MHTKQQIFNIVVEHLFKQGIAAFDIARDICAYRSPEGLTCAIGCLIPDEHYNSLMEGKDVETLYAYYTTTFSHFEQYVPFLGRLQEIHDQTMPRFKIDVDTTEGDVELYHREMRSVVRRLHATAVSHDLDMPWHVVPELYSDYDADSQS